MELLRNTKLVHRFMILIIWLTLGFVIYGFWSFKTLGELKVNGPIYQRIVQGKDLVADILPPPEYIIESYLVGLQLVTSSSEQHAGLIERLQTLKSEYDTRHEFWSKQDLSAELQQLLLVQAHTPAIEFYDLAFKQFIPALHNGDSQTADRAMQQMKSAYDAHRRAVDQVVQLANQRVKIDEAEAAENIKLAMLTMLAVLIVAIVLCLIVALAISESVTGPLTAMQKTMLEIKNRRDFTRRIELDSRDEVGSTAQSFNQLLETVHAALSQISNHADELSRASQALSVAAQQVAASSGQQSSAASSIAATVEQLNVSIGQVTDSAGNALKISRQSGEFSNQGGEIIHHAAGTMMQIAQTVQQTSTTIEDLGQQSKRISSVVQVIKDVADQTNLLALNAAIEAARAGEQGRGFAVVADEVRNLAKRTSKATEEISHMIETMQTSTGNAINVMSAAMSKADQGSSIASQAGEAINQIKRGSSQVVDVVKQISAALMEQNSASNNIAAHVEQVANMAETNNLAIERAADSALKLQELAGEMRATVASFKL